MIVDLNNEHFFSISLNSFGSSLNFAVILDANFLPYCFVLQCLSVTGDLRDFLLGKGF